MQAVLATIVEWSRNRPVWAVVLVVAVTIALGVQFRTFEVTADFASFLPKDSRTVATLKKVEESFGAGANEMIMVRSETRFDTSRLHDLSPLTTQVRSIEGVTGVISPLSAPAFIADQLIAEDGKAVLFLVQVGPDADPSLFPNHLRESVAATQFPAGMKALVTGPLSVEKELIKASEQDNMRLFTLALVAIIGVVWLTFWRLRSVVIAVAIVLLAVTWALGAVVAAGQSITVISFSAILLIVALGIDYVIHYVRRVDEASRLGETFPFAFAARTTGRSILLAALTTIVGFLSFLTTGFPPIAQFGVIAAIGVFSSFLLTLLLVPALYKPTCKTRPKALPDRIEDLMSKLGLVVMGRPRLVWWGAAVTCLAASIGISQIQVGSPPLQVNTPAQLRLDEIEQTFGGVRSATILIHVGNGNSDGSLDQVTTLMGKLASLDGLRVIAPWYRQGGITRIPGWVSGNSARIIVQYEPEHAPDVIAALQALLEPFEAFADLTGRDAIQAEIEGRVLGGLGISSILAFSLILLLLTLFLRNVRLALVTLFPMVLVIWWQLGTMPLLGIRLSTTTVTTAALVLGIGIDYAVHVVERIQEESTREGGPVEAVVRVMRSTGPGIVSGALTTAAGFFILGTSQIANLRDYGLLTGVAVIYGLLASFFLLPHAVTALRREPRWHDSGDYDA